jgi:hypothetical protein
MADPYSKSCRYRVTRTSYIGGVMYVVQDGGPEVFVDYAGNPGTNMEPTDDEGRRRQAAIAALLRFRLVVVDEVRVADAAREGAHARRGDLVRPGRRLDAHHGAHLRRDLDLLGHGVLRSAAVYRVA